MGTGSRDERLQNGTGGQVPWLPILEREMRQRMGWVDELVSPFARSKRRPGAKAAVHLVSADTLLFSASERKSA
jgi:hypothetical protein